MWFRNKQDEGIIHEDNFNPLSIEALALVLAAVNASLLVFSNFSNMFPLD
jgi:hypothetical protein